MLQQFPAAPQNLGTFENLHQEPGSVDLNIYYSNDLFYEESSTLDVNGCEDMK